MQSGILLSLFGTFFRIGLFTFGGGYAMIPLIEDACVERRGWITHGEMAEITVIAESTPGPVAINCATFVGNRRGGFPGALAATAGVVLPSFLVILGIFFFLENILEITWIANAFRGIRVAVSLLILRAGLRMLRRIEKKPLPLLLFAGAAGCIFGTAVRQLPASCRHEEQQDGQDGERLLPCSFHLRSFPGIPHGWFTVPLSAPDKL